MARWHIAVHLIRRTMGTKRGLLLNVLLPAVLLSVFAGLFSSLQGGAPRVAISDLDEGSYGSELVAFLKEESAYDVRSEERATEEELQQLVRQGHADAALYIPYDFSQKLVSGSMSQPVLYRMNEQLWSASLAASLHAEASRLAETSRLAGAVSGQPDQALLDSLLLAQSEHAVSALHTGMKLGTIISDPMIFGLVIMFLMLLMNQTIGFIMEDRELRTMARMYTAPLRSWDIAVGNFVGSVGIGTLQLVIMLSLLYFVFGFSPGISFGGMLLVLECFLLAVLGLVSVAAGLVRNRSQQSHVSLLLLVPTCMISGCFFPISLMPVFIQKLANFTPQKWALQALDMLASGKTVADISLQLAILLLFAALLLAFGAAVLQPSRTTQ